MLTTADLDRLEALGGGGGATVAEQRALIAQAREALDARLEKETLLALQGLLARVCGELLSEWEGHIDWQMDSCLWGPLRNRARAAIRAGEEITNG